MNMPRLTRVSRSEWFGEKYFTMEEIENEIKNKAPYLLNLDRYGKPLPDYITNKSKYVKHNISGEQDDAADAVRAFLGYSIENGQRHYYAVEMHQFVEYPAADKYKTVVFVKELDEQENEISFASKVLDKSNTKAVTDEHKTKLCNKFIVETRARTFEELVEKASV